MIIPPDAILPLIGLGFFVGCLCGFSIWELLDRTKWAAYRAVYRRYHEDAG